MSAPGTLHTSNQDVKSKLRLHIKRQVLRLKLGRHVAESLEWSRANRDASENRESSPPETERVRILCLWMVEFYPPSSRQSLFRAFRTLGWHDDRELFPDSAPSRWTKRVRSWPRDSSWLNVGLLVPIGKERSWVDARAVPLPLGVVRAHVHLYHVLPSHTAAIIQFIFDDDTAAQVEQALRRTYESTAKRRGRRYVILGPDYLKKEAVGRVRAALRDRCASWYRGHIPGNFAKGHLGGHFPTFELMLFQEAEPLRFTEKRPPGNYLWQIGVDLELDAWTCPEFAGLRLSVLGGGEDDEFAFVLAAKDSDLLLGDNLDGYGGRNAHGFTNYLQHLHGTMIRLSLLPELTGYEHRLAELRDQAAVQLGTLTTKGNAPGVAASKLMALREDAIPFGQELARLAESSTSFQRDTYCFEAVDKRFYGDDSLLETMRTDLLDRVESLKNALTGFGETLSAAAKLKAAAAQERLARSNVVIQIILVVLTIVLLVFTWRTLAP